jgi:hypothetical protein
MRNGSSRNKNIGQPQQQSTPYVDSIINQPSQGYWNNHHWFGSNISGQTNRNTYNINPPTVNNDYMPAFQQGTQYGYKPQVKLDEIKPHAETYELKTQTIVGEFEWLTHTYAINYFPHTVSIAEKIADIVWASLTKVKKIVIYTNQSNYSKIND